LAEAAPEAAAGGALAAGFAEALAGAAVDATGLAAVEGAAETGDGLAAGTAPPPQALSSRPAASIPKKRFIKNLDLRSERFLRQMIRARPGLAPAGTLRLP
jgi:hypothetical protein